MQSMGVNKELLDNLMDQSNQKDRLYSQVISDYQSGKYSLRSLARKYNMTRYKIKKLFKNNDVHKHPKDRLEKMAKLYHKCHSMKKVSKVFGVTKADVWYLFKSHGIKRDKSTNEKGREMKKRDRNDHVSDSGHLVNERQFLSAHQTTSKHVDPFKQLQFIHKTIEYYKKHIYLLRHNNPYKKKYEQAEAKIKKLEKAIDLV